MIPAIILILIFLTPFVITYLKRKKQLGITWGGPVESSVIIQDKELQCSHCGHNKFEKREGLLTTSWVTFFRFPFWNYSASCFVCRKCGFLHWFVNPKEKTSFERASEE